MENDSFCAKRSLSKEIIDPENFRYFMTRQPIPKVSEKDVERIVQRDFPAERIQQVHAILHEYGTDDTCRNRHRVRLAALKLAAGNMEQLRILIDTAKKDYRDILANAEYPNYFKKIDPSKKYSAAKLHEIINCDWKLYQEWLWR